MSDTGKYTNQGKTVTIQGVDYCLQGMGFAEILSEAINHILHEHKSQPKAWADSNDLHGQDRIDFLMRWMEKNPEPEGEKLSQMALDFAGSAEGVVTIVAKGLSDQAELTLEESRKVIADCEPEELWDLSNTLYGGIINLGKKKTPRKPARKPRRKKAKA